MEKGTLREVVGDATAPQITQENEIAIIPHVANNLKGWGAGFVLALSKKDTTPETCYKNMFKDYVIPRDKKEMLGQVSFSSFCQDLKWQEIDNFRHFQTMDAVFPSKMIVANMIAQDGVRGNSDFERPLRYTALIECMQKVGNWITNEQMHYPNKKFTIHTCKFGSDLAGGDFNFITELINEVWIESGIDVTIYEFLK